MRVRNGLGNAGRARRIQHPDRMFERHRVEGEFRHVGAEGVVPQNATGQGLACILGLEVGYQHQLFDRGQLFADGLHVALFVKGLPIILVAVDGKEHLRFDLLEAVDNAVDPEIGRATRPDRAQRASRQKGNGGLRDVRQESHDPVAPAHADRLQVGPHRGDLLPELGPTDLDQFVPLRAKEDGRPVGMRMAEGMLGIVERSSGEPPEIGHGLAGKDRAVWLVENHLEIIGDARPETLEVVDRPFPKSLVIVEFQVFFPGEPLQIVRETGLSAESFARIPEQGWGGVGVGRHGRAVG